MELKNKKLANEEPELPESQTISEDDEEGVSGGQEPIRVDDELMPNDIKNLGTMHNRFTV